MINIERSGTKINVQVDTAWLGVIYYFTYDCGTEPYAKLLNKHVNDKFADTVQAIRQEAYNVGYKHGKQHTAKLTWFSRLFKIGTF